MLKPLVAKLRERHPAADLVMALPEAYAPLYTQAPYGLRAIGWDPRGPAASPLWRELSFDLARVPGDNRFSWPALALGARWITAFADDRPAVEPCAQAASQWTSRRCARTRRPSTSQAARKGRALAAQRTEVARCLDTLLERAGDRRAFRRIYRQLKMYNSPELNPYLYGGKR